MTEKDMELFRDIQEQALQVRLNNQIIYLWMRNRGLIVLWVKHNSNLFVHLICKYSTVFLCKFFSFCKLGLRPLL